MNERKDVLTDPADIKWIISEHCKRLYTHKLDTFS